MSDPKEKKGAKSSGGKRGGAPDKPLNGDGNGNGHVVNKPTQKMSVADFRFEYLKSITGYEWTDDAVKRLNEQMRQDPQNQESGDPASSWPGL